VSAGAGKTLDNMLSAGAGKHLGSAIGGMGSKRTLPIQMCLLRLLCEAKCQCLTRVPSSYLADFEVDMNGERSLGRQARVFL